MEQDVILTGLLSELRRGTIVLCVLNQLKKPKYGYSLVSALSDSGIAIEANTLYPLLRRLEVQGLLSSMWETTGSKPRKYYLTTEMGNDVCHILKKQWDETVISMNRLWEGTEHEE